MTTTKALLIAAGVAVGAYVILEVMRPPRATSGIRPTGSQDGAWISNLLNFGAAFAASVPSGGGNTYGGSSPTADPSWYDNQQGIDPTTGGVLLAPGDTYGPRFPT